MCDEWTNLDWWILIPLLVLPRAYHRSITLLPQLQYWKQILRLRHRPISWPSIEMTGERRRRRREDLFKYYWNSSDYHSHVCACLIGLTFFCSVPSLLLCPLLKQIFQCCFAHLYHLSFKSRFFLKYLLDMDISLIIIHNKTVHPR